MNDSFKNGVPCKEKGAALNHFISGRISAGLAVHGGFRYIAYQGGQTLGHHKIFHGDDASCYGKLVRIQIMIDGKAWFPEFNHTEFHPFGFRSECTLNQVKFLHETVLDRDTLFQRITVAENPEGHKIGARILHNSYTTMKMPDRDFTPWSVSEDGALHIEMTDGGARIPIRISCSLPVKTHAAGSKYYMETADCGNSVVFAVSFCSSGENGNERMDSVFRGYEDRRRTGVSFETGSEKMDSALNNIIPVLDSLAVPDVPGAVRASQNYWVWGWDSMVHAEAYLWSGNTQIVYDMLNFYRETADPVEGIVHACDPIMKGFCFMKKCSQGIYIVLLHNYFAATGDLAAVRKFHGFVRSLLEKIGETQHPACHLGRGRGYFPDVTKLLEQTDSDLSLINNSLYLQSLRAVSALEQALGNTAESERLRLNADLVQADLEKILWDEQAGYWMDSASGSDFAGRRYHPLYGQLYISPEGDRPHSKNAVEIAAYMKRHFLFEHGLYMYCPDEPGFMADGNQLGAYYPPMDRYYWNMMNRVQDIESAADFRKIVEYFWNWYSYPEGLTHETVNEDPTVDEPGGKQAFSMKGWFCDVLELNLGLRVFADGFSCSPLNTGTAFTVRNLVLRGKKLTLERTPQGTVLLNQKELSAGKHSWAELEKYTEFTQI